MMSLLSTYIRMYVYICICSYSYCTICVLLSLSGFQLENGEMSVCVNSIKILRFTNVHLLTVFCHFNTLICGLVCISQTYYNSLYFSTFV